MTWLVANGNASSERSVRLRPCRSSRERGPMTPKTAYAEVTSTATTWASGRMWEVIQARSRTMEAEPVTSRYSSWATRVTVTSAS